MPPNEIREGDHARHGSMRSNRALQFYFHEKDILPAGLRRVRTYHAPDLHRHFLHADALDRVQRPVVSPFHVLAHIFDLRRKDVDQPIAMVVAAIYVGSDR
jgi:hypothetical protein